MRVHCLVLYPEQHYKTDRNLFDSGRQMLYHQNKSYILTGSGAILRLGNDQV